MGKRQVTMSLEASTLLDNFMSLEDSINLSEDVLLLSLIADKNGQSAPLAKLSKKLVDRVLAEDEKTQLQLHILSQGKCYCLEDVWSFSNLDSVKIDSAIAAVTDWIVSDSKSDILSQAAISGRFSKEDKKNIAALAWKTPMC